MALGTLFVFPFFIAAKPPWLWGFLLAIILLLAVALLIGEGLSRSPVALLPRLFRPPLRWLHLPLVGLLIWSGVQWLSQVWSAPEGLFSIHATNGMAFLWAFTAAWLLGTRLGLRGRHLLSCAFVFWLGALLCALWCVLSWWLQWPPEYFHWPLNLQRPFGPMVNANRFAVHLSMGLFCGLALWSVRWRLARPPAPPRRGFLDLALLAGCTLIFVALCLTLSRLTILAVGLALGLGALLWVQRRWSRKRIGPHRASSHILPVVRLSTIRSRRALLRRWRVPILFLMLVAFSIAFLSLAHLIGRRDLAVRYTETSSEMEPDYLGRRKVMGRSLGLFLQQPLGRGLGGFENAYRQVQPHEDTAKRWCEVHNDWLQVAVELGLPGIGLLVLAFLAWWLLWWPALQTGRSLSFYLGMPLGLAVLVPSFCSLADFPLREPVTGLQFFFLAGALVAWLGRVSGTRDSSSHDAAGDGRDSIMRASSHAQRAEGDTLSAGQAGKPDLRGGGRIASIALAVLFLPWILFSLNVGRAVSISPWCGYIYPPSPDAGQVAGYREALRIFPSYRPLLTQYGLALSRGLDLKVDHERAQELIGVADRIRRIDAADYVAPMLRARALVALERWEDAADEADRGVALAPSYADVRLFAIGTLLQAAYYRKDWTHRLERVEQARVHMRYLLSVSPGLKDRFTKQLRDLGLWPDEVAALWPPDDPASRFPRARYWASQRDWLRLDDEVCFFTEEERGSPWFAAWQGRSQLYYGDVGSGLVNWRKAVAANGPELPELPELRRWLGSEARYLAPDVVDRWVEQSGHDIAQDPVLVLQLAPWLESKGHALRAELLMGEAMRESSQAKVFRYAAELSVRLNDPAEALHRAKQAWNLSDKGPEWSEWLTGIEKRAAGKGVKSR